MQLSVHFFGFFFYILLLDKLLLNIEKRQMRPSIFHKYKKKKLNRFQKLFFLLLHIWEKRIIKSWLHNGIDCVILLSIVLYVNYSWETYKTYIISDWFLVLFSEPLLISSTREIKLLRVFSCNELMAMSCNWRCNYQI